MVWRVGANCYTTANRQPAQITAAVWHTLEGSAPSAVDWWTQSGTASAHIIIRRDGAIWLTVEPKDIAWHAGTNNDPNGGVYGRTPFWRAHNINGSSLGIECEGFAASTFPAAQIAAIRRVADWLTATYPIPRQHTFDQIAGHHAHSEISANRGDPGPHWDWAWVL